MKRKLKLTQHEISLMMALTSTLDPDDYEEDEVKQVILGAQGVMRALDGGTTITLHS